MVRGSPRSESDRQQCTSSKPSGEKLAITASESKHLLLGLEWVDEQRLCSWCANLPERPLGGRHPRLEHPDGGTHKWWHSGAGRSKRSAAPVRCRIPAQREAPWPTLS